MDKTQEKNTVTSYAKGRAYFKNLFQQGKIPVCSPGYISGRCGNGHKFAAPFLCGKEYCPECGKDGSPIHVRRVQRWSQYIHQFKSLGYLVFTFPKPVRFLFEDKKMLTNFRYELRRKLTRDGYTKGLARWHFYGDCKICNGAGCKQCNETGSGNEYHPHLNVFIEEKFIDDLQNFIKPFQTWAANWIIKKLRDEIKKRTLFIEKYGIPDEKAGNIYDEISQISELIREQKKENYVINYSYTTDKIKIINRIKYVTRSTFRRYDTEMKENLHNFRNAVKWGVKKIETEQHVEICPECQTAIQWNNLEKFNPNIKFKTYEKSYYRLAARDDPDHHSFKTSTATGNGSNSGNFTRSRRHNQSYRSADRF